GQGDNPPRHHAPHFTQSAISVSAIAEHATNILLCPYRSSLRMNKWAAQPHRETQATGRGPWSRIQCLPFVRYQLTSGPRASGIHQARFRVRAELRMARGRMLLDCRGARRVESALPPIYLVALTDGELSRLRSTVP